jgi:S-DNA-T family DNA segregation ATPase FtsK/SpoIIIE
MEEMGIVKKHDKKLIYVGLPKTTIHQQKDNIEDNNS